MEENIDKFKFVVDEVGYTWTTSPMLAFKKSLETQKLQMGDYIIFWTVGSRYYLSDSFI